MIKLALRIIINAIAFWVAALVVPGMSLVGGIPELLLVAIVFGLVNTFIRPIVKLLTLPINVVTLGLFTLVINALMLMLIAWLLDVVVLEGALWGFVPALMGSIVISIVSTVLSWFLPD